MSDRRRMSRIRLFPLLLAGAVGCSGGGGGTDPDPQPQPTPVPTSINVTPDDPTLPDAGSLTLTATVSDQNGRVMTTLPAGSTLAWTSRDLAVATVNESGVVLAQRPGTVWVRAQAGALADSTRVTVTAVPAQLAVVGSPQRAGTAGTLVLDSLAVRVTDRHGTAMQGITVAFAAAGGTTTPATAVTRADGTAKSAWRLGSSVGTQTATATVAGLAGSPATFTANAAAPIPASIEVTPVFATVDVGATTAFSAVVRSTEGDIIVGAAVSFSTAGTNVTLTSAGSVTGLTPGVNRIVGAVNDLRDTSVVAVFGPSTILGTAFAAGTPYAIAQRGDTLRVPVLLDMSRPSPTGDLGSIQLEVVYDPAVLELVRAENVLPGSAGNVRIPGRYAIAYAGTQPLGTPTVRLATVVLVVRGTAAAGAVSPMTLLVTEAPRKTDFAPLSTPLIVHGRVYIP
ncbi:MAG TPA: Ig-like domain-containing protein [Longimicrobium sp.]|nr:Ig-like domain-containing protein [Longimicrobium sp.]